jgi:alkylated DNA repair dioxygenase AlkB
MPCLPEDYENCSDEDLSRFIQDAVNNANGWDVLAGIIERVKRYKFGKKHDAHELDASCTESHRGGVTRHEQKMEDSKVVSTCFSEQHASKVPQKSYRFINQMTVNEYKPGEGIGSHIDTHSAFGDGIMSISLGADCVMSFKSSSSIHNDGLKKLVYLPARSLLLMSGPARYTWSHQIVTRMTDCVNGTIIPRNTRLSLTLRTAITIPTHHNESFARPLPAIASREFPPKWGKQSTSSTSIHHGKLFLAVCR